MNTSRIAELQNAELDARMRRDELLRWSAEKRKEDGSYAAGVRHGLRATATFVASGRFGHMELCVHGSFPGCPRCAEDDQRELDLELASDEVGLLKALAERRANRLAQVTRWEWTYRKGAPKSGAVEFSMGVAAGLGMARDYLETGILHTGDELGRKAMRTLQWSATA